VSVTDKHPRKQIKRNGREYVDGEQASRVMFRAVCRHTIKDDIEKEEQVDEIKKLKALERTGLIESKLVGDQHAADYDQQQYQRVPDKARSGEFAYHVRPAPVPSKRRKRLFLAG
jgi:hypothetical protein